jgi:hypothetical protein
MVVYDKTRGESNGEAGDAKRKKGGEPPNWPAAPLSVQLP